MIIFDLDGCLADCEHRRHLVDPSKNNEYCWEKFNFQTGKMASWVHKETGVEFRPNWKAFYETCYDDIPIKPTIRVLYGLYACDKDRDGIEIWSGRCQSAREKTSVWLRDACGIPTPIITKLKMRPMLNIDELWDLKQQWYLDLAISEGKDVDFVFDSDPESIEMWRRRGIFVFDVKQTRKEF